MTSIRKKGDPPAKYLKGKYPEGHPKEGQGIGRDRERQVIRHYLETGGVNPMNGKPVAFSEAQLDHITSLDNGGVDGGENWMWMEARINQFKGSLTDTEVESKLIERDLTISPLSLSALIHLAITNMAISTFTIQFNEYELETISSALADYRDYAEGATDPILARCNAIDDKIDEAFKNQ